MPEGVFAAFFVEQKGQYGIFADVVGDVFLGVISPHGRPVVDVLLEDVTDHVRVDIASAGLYPVIQVPVPLVKEIEDFLKRLVADVDLLKLPFQLVHVEQAPVEVGNSS